MSDQEDIKELRAKLEEQAAQFESYKQQCKQIESMLEEDCQKKEQEIKQLKQEAIKRQKGQKILKAQLSQLDAELENLKNQLQQSSTTRQSANSQREQIEKLTEQTIILRNKNTQLQNSIQKHLKSLAHLQASLFQQNKKNQLLTKLLNQAQNRSPIVTSATNKQSASPKFQEEIKKLKEKISNLEKQKTKFEKLSKQRDSQIQKIKHEYEQKDKKINQLIQATKNKEKQDLTAKREKSQQKQIKETIYLSEHKQQVSKLKQTIQQVEQRAEKWQNLQKQCRKKINTMTNQKQSLLQKIKSLQKQLQKEREKKIQSIQSPQKQAHDQIVIEDSGQEMVEFNSCRMDCWLLTKRHYISPFIEIKDNKFIKIYKSTKNGFEKSLGATKHKFDSVGYDLETLVQNSVTYAKESLSHNYSHTILIYGSKRTNKKYVMAAIVKNLKESILQKVDQLLSTSSLQSQSQNHKHSVVSLYMKQSVDEDKKYLREVSNNKEQITEILDEIIEMGQPSLPSKTQTKSKKNQKPKVRYLSITFAQVVTLQIITTSYLNQFIKNNQTFIDYLNTIVFSKLPNILQSSITNYHVITTINPIVNLYEECKNTLSITLVPAKSYNNPNQIQSLEPDSRMLNTPQGINKEDLNEMTKKKLQSFEKETEQAGIKIRKIEEECSFLRGRFQQLQIRLKNLINTHQPQNSYLKKSPVTLSYQKLLKFVNSVLVRNVTSYSRGNMSPNLRSTSPQGYNKQVQMYIQEDSKSLDGY